MWSIMFCNGFSSFLFSSKQAIKIILKLSKEKNSDINVTKKVILSIILISENWLQWYKFSLAIANRDLTLSSSPCIDTRHQPEEKSVHTDSLYDRKIVTLLLRNKTLVLPSMILSFVYLLSISKMKIRTRNKCHWHYSLIV